MAYWLLKTEPETYSFEDLVRLGRDHWDGVRNFQARANIKAMRPGDMALIYHSGKTREVVGTAQIISMPYPDPHDHRFLWVDIEAGRKLPRPVTLAEIKADARFTHWELVRQARLSVMPVPLELWDAIIAMATTEKQ